MTPADKSVTLEKDVTVYAKWTAKEAGYTIAYFRQVWDNSTDSAHYVYDSSVSASGVVGTTVTGTAKRNGIANCEFASADSATIKADGSTVVNVYYDLIQYTFIFDLNDRNGNTGKIVMNGKTYDDVNRYEIKAVLGQDISALWPTTEHTSRSNGDELDTWNGNYKTKRFEVTADMVTGADENHEVIYGAQWMDDGTKKTVNYWFQKADGSGYEKEERYCQEFVSDSGLSAKNIYGFTKIDRPSGYPESSDTVYNFYYNRNSYAIEYYYNGTQLKTASNIRFGADISSSTYNYTPERPEGLDSEYTFAGWYDNAELLGEPYNFTTMPANTLALYAKWEAPDKTVTLVYNDGSANGSITVKKGEVAEIPVPEREGYDFAGWYSDIGCLVPFDVNAPVTQDVIIYAKWMKHLFTQYTVRYVVADETAEGGYRDIADSKTLRGMVDSVVREKALALDGEYAGYAVDASSKTLTLKSSASENVIMFIYTSPADLKYKVRYTYDGKVVREGDWTKAPATKFRVDPLEDDAKWLNENGYERNESFIIANLVSNNDENIITFTLKLKPYTIKYEGIDGITGWTTGTGTENPNKTSYTIEDEFTLVNPVKTGYTFTGWTEPNNSDFDGTNVTVSKGSRGHLVFTANWTENAYTVKYDTQGGTPAIEDKTNVKWNDAGLLPAETPTKTGYTFEGWKHNDTNVAAATTYATLAVDDSVESVTLTAQWKRDWTAIEVEPYEDVYDGQKHGVTVNGVVEGDKVQYSVDGKNFSDTVPEYADVTKENDGRYPVYVKVTNGTESIDKESYVKINPKPLTLISADDTKVYDGTPLTNNGYTYTENVLVEGHELTAVVEGSVTNVAEGKVANKVVSYKIMNGEEDVTENYAVTPKDGELEVTAKAVTITAENKAFTYTGEAQSWPEYNVEGLVGDDSISATVEGSIQYVSQSPVENKVTGHEFTKGEASNYNVSYTSGQLTMSKAEAREIEITAASQSWTYDGAAHSNAGVSLTGGELFTGDRLVASAEGSVTNVAEGKVANKVVSYKIMNGEEDVTENYAVTPKDGELEVTAKAVTITAENKAFTYTGEAQSWPEYNVEGLVGDDSISATVEGSIQYVSQSPVENKVTGHEFTKGEASNYNVSYTSGQLTMSKAEAREIEITAASQSWTYDGAAHSNAGVSLTGGELFTGDRLVASAEGSVTNVAEGKVANKVVSYKIMNGEEDVTENYAVTPKDGELEVTSRILTVTTPSDSKVYDGIALTAAGTMTGLVDNETVTFTTIGSQTYVGQSDNTYSIKWDGTAKRENYAIVEKIGTLTVTAGTPDKPVDPNKVVTKTHEDKTYGLGDTIVFNIEVKNIYDEEKTITISEQEGVTITGQFVFENVAPGEKVTTTAEYIVTEEDLLAGTFTNKVTASFDGGKDFENTDTVDKLEDPKGHLTVNKSAVSTPENGKAYSAGEKVIYKITATNDGNLTLTNVVVSDELTRDEWTIESLAPGESKEFTAEYVVTEADVLAGEVVNVATATGESPDPDKPEPDVDPDEEVVPVSKDYTLTIHYIDADGKTMAPDYTGTFVYQTPYSVKSPSIDGYTPDIEVVEGTMPAKDIEYNVVYTKNPIPVIPPKPTKPQLIQTGQLNWPIPVLAIVGILLFAFGLILIFKKRKSYES